MSPLILSLVMKWLLCLTIATTSQAAVELKAGVSRLEITPSAFMEMYGYANRKCGPAKRIFASSVFFGTDEAGESRQVVWDLSQIPLLRSPPSLVQSGT